MSYDPQDHITGIRRIIETREIRIHDYNDVALFSEGAASEARAVGCSEAYSRCFRGLRGRR